MNTERNLAVTECEDAGEPRVPPDIEDFMERNGWLEHHRLWHAARRCKPLSRPTREQFEEVAVPCNPLQEGDRGSGLEFLAMHRVMIQDLTSQFPNEQSLHDALLEFPLTNEFADSLPSRTVDGMPIGHSRLEAKRDAIRFLLWSLEKPYRAGSIFVDDDEIGCFLETIRNPRPDHSPGNPDLRGLHAFFHELYGNRNSSCIDVANFSVNLLNLRFWRIHGWVDRLWQRYRDVLGLPDSQPEYQAAIWKQRKDMSGMTRHAAHHHHGLRDLPKEVIAQITERDGRW
jgi:hypothetical protein